MSLESIVSDRLAKLSLSNEEGGQASQLTEQDPEETLTFVLGIVQENSFEREDKKSAILAFLEKEEDVAIEKSIDEMLDETGALQEEERAKEAEEQKKIAEEKAAASKQGSRKTLTPEEEAARKQELVSSYGYVEEEDEEAERLAAEEAAAGNGAGDAVFVDPRTLTKKARKKAEAKQAEAGVDLLMRPNMNAAIVKGAELQRRKEDAAKAAAKREKDKFDLKKQKEDAAKKLLEKQKKAQKGERKA